MNNPFESNNSFGNILPSVISFMIMCVIVASMFNVESFDNNQIPVFENHTLLKSKFKEEKLPTEGLVRLIKGNAVVSHHNIKEDSIIMLSRKNIEGKPGLHLIVNIEANSSFTITSVNSDSVVEIEDYSEIFFLVK